MYDTNVFYLLQIFLVGIYLTVTLFFLYSDSLLELVDASSLKEWISSICLVEGMPWFRKIGINVIHAGHPVSFSSDVGVSVDGDARHQQERQAWLRFTNGWLYATIGRCVLSEVCQAM